LSKNGPNCGSWANNGLWRLIGGLNALTGQVSYLDNYIIGRAKVREAADLEERLAALEKAAAEDRKG
jgi:hypothetical protein